MSTQPNTSPPSTSTSSPLNPSRSSTSTPNTPSLSTKPSNPKPKTAASSSTPPPTDSKDKDKGKKSAQTAVAGGKDAKKEKRAAAVAARAAAGGGGGAGGEGSGGSQGQGRPNGAPGGKGPGSGGGGGQASTSTRQQGGTAMNQPGNQSAAVQPSLTTSTAINPTPAPPTQSLFSHLPTSTPPHTSSALLTSRIHPLCIRYGLLISTGQIRGSNARVIGLMSTFKQVIKDFENCPKEEMHRLLPIHLSPMISFLDGCRPKGVGGGNAIRYLKSEINRICTSPSHLITDSATQKTMILNSIDEFLRDRIELADEVISGFMREKIRKGMTVVTYARSSLVERCLVEAWEGMRQEEEGAEFNVIVVDSGPLFEGKHLLKVLQSTGIPCTYTLLPSLPSLLSRASLVLLGTAALLSDGALYSRAGTAMVALLAKESRIPVVACCETYKFGEKVVLDAVTGNELGETKDWWTPSSSIGADGAGAENAAGIKKKTKAVEVTPIHLLYDLTPASLITAVCTEVGFIPPSSVPTVIVKGDNSAL